MLINKVMKYLIDPIRYSSKNYTTYLRKHGIHIGDYTVVYSPHTTSIDVQKPNLISIGSYCKITSGVIILAHDYSISVSRRVSGEFVGGILPVRIGDNCFVGMNSIILPGTVIGNNCIVGAGSVVKGTFPDNVVIAGNPAKTVCSLEEYTKKHKERWVEDARRCAREIFINTGKIPTISDMGDGFYWLYTQRTQINIDKHRAYFTLSADDYESVCESFLVSKPVFSNFDDFLKICDFSRDE